MRTDMAYRKKAVSEQEKKRIAKRFLTGILGIADDGLLKRLEEKAELINLKKGELYIMEGKSCGKVSFLMEGAAMGWRQEPDGRVQVDSFLVRSGAPVISDGKIGQVSPVNFTMVTSGRILAFPAEVIKEGMESSLELTRAYTKDLLESLRGYMMIRNICQRSARERYEWFLQEYGGCEYKIPDKYIASFLNMAPETLSRIKKEV